MNYQLKKFIFHRQNHMNLPKIEIQRRRIVISCQNCWEYSSKQCQSSGVSGGFCYLIYSSKLQCAERTVLNKHSSVNGELASKIWYKR